MGVQTMTLFNAIGVVMTIYGVFLASAASNDERGNFVLAQHAGMIMAAIGIGLIIL